jgi:nitroreductase
MDLLEIIKNRRSIRSFKKQAVPQEIIEKLLEAQGGRLPQEAFNHGRL